MAANVVNSTIIKPTRGRPVKLGTVTAQNDAVAFSLSADSAQTQYIIIATSGGTTPTFALEASLDGGVKWFSWIGTQQTMFTNLFTVTGVFGDAACTAAFGFLILGSAGALYRFGRTDANGGGSDVWALVG